MDVLTAIALGVLQGLTEFLPISSSGHLVLAQQLFVADLSNSVAFDVCLHFGTFVAVLVYFRADLTSMLMQVTGRGGYAEEPYLFRWIWLLAAATVPLVVFALLFRHQLAELFESVTAVGIALCGTAALLWLASRSLDGERGPDDIRLIDALVIGAFQAVAIVPGVSRSGATITGGLVRGVDPATAARFAFLLSLPAIAGAMIDQLSGVSELLSAHPSAVIAGTVAAAATGLLAIEAMMRAVRMGRLAPFAVYCLVLGCAALARGAGWWPGG